MSAKMVELLSEEGCQRTFDDAIKQAETLTGVEVPEEMRGHVLVAAFKIATPGKIPGLPEA